MVSETTIFYFDIGVQQKDKGLVSRKAIVKSVQKYIKQKEKNDPDSKWGIVLFQHGEDNPSFIENLANDESEFEKYLQDNLKTASKEHPLEQGLMLASTYLVEAFRTTRDHVYRIIVISDGPSGENNLDLTNALLDMLETVKFFPVYIDIIRYGDQRVYPDDIKLKFLTDATRGGVFYADSENAFKRILEEQFSSLERPFDIYNAVPAKLMNYYEGLCFNLQQSNSPGFTCTACKNGPTPSLGSPVACEKCGATYHERCIQELPNRVSVGLPGITRCIQCGALLSPSLVKSGPLVVPHFDTREILKIDDAPLARNLVPPARGPPPTGSDGIELVESPSPELVKPTFSISPENSKGNASAFPSRSPAMQDEGSPEPVRVKFTPQRPPVVNLSPPIERKDERGPVQPPKKPPVVNLAPPHGRKEEETETQGPSTDVVPGKPVIVFPDDEKGTGVETKQDQPPSGSLTKPPKPQVPDVLGNAPKITFKALPGQQGDGDVKAVTGPAAKTPPEKQAGIVFRPVGGASTPATAQALAKPAVSSSIVAAPRGSPAPAKSTPAPQTRGSSRDECDITVISMETVTPSASKNDACTDSPERQREKTRDKKGNKDDKDDVLVIDD